MVKYRGVPIHFKLLVIGIICQRYVSALSLGSWSRKAASEMEIVFDKSVFLMYVFVLNKYAHFDPISIHCSNRFSYKKIYLSFRIKS